MKALLSQKDVAIMLAIATKTKRANTPVCSSIASAFGKPEPGTAHETPLGGQEKPLGGQETPLGGQETPLGDQETRRQDAAFEPRYKEGAVVVTHAKKEKLKFDGRKAKVLRYRTGKGGNLKAIVKVEMLDGPARGQTRYFEEIALTPCEESSPAGPSSASGVSSASTATAATAGEGDVKEDLKQRAAEAAFSFFAGSKKAKAADADVRI